MRNILGLSLAIAVIAVACSKPEEPAKLRVPPKSDVQTPAPMPVPGLSPAPEQGPVSVGGADALVGTVWAIGDVIVTFKDESKVFAKGGFIAPVAPEGIEATYTLSGNLIELTALDHTITGTFDGTNLVIDGKSAVRQQ